MKDTIAELWHGNIFPQTESRNNTPAMKELMEYMARYHESLLKSVTDEQKDILERFDDCWSEYASLAEEAIFVYAISREALSYYENGKRNPDLKMLVDMSRYFNVSIDYILGRSEFRN